MYRQIVRKLNEFLILGIWSLGPICLLLFSYLLKLSSIFSTTQIILFLILRILISSLWLYKRRKIILWQNTNFKNADIDFCFFLSLRYFSKMLIFSILNLSHFLKFSTSWKCLVLNCSSFWIFIIFKFYSWFFLNKLLLKFFLWSFKFFV